MSHWVSYLKDWACDEGRENFSKHKCTLIKEFLVDSTWVETEALEPMILNVMVDGYERKKMVMLREPHMM